ncbi:hypothetical protein [Leisingera sp. M523]|uniref:hypothetical protein n=1 Tax=Leisingera sp. M523 TaxID=2867013 RepID=UPI0021A827F1|nr:hypothetical protein [Leisingera sp. M523]UWQ27190.1 hypothetical protein K3557_10090 [Leisingera sp. M523]
MRFASNPLCKQVFAAEYSGKPRQNCKSANFFARYGGSDQGITRSGKTHDKEKTFWHLPRLLAVHR